MILCSVLLGVLFPTIVLSVRQAFNVIWSFKTGQKLALAYDHSGNFLHFRVERGRVNLLNSTDLCIYFAEVWLLAPL